jgi:hypothetical protein
MSDPKKAVIDVRGTAGRWRLWRQPGRASVLASGNFLRVSEKYGLAGTLALPPLQRENAGVDAA